MSSYLTKDLKVGDFLNVMQPNGTFCLNDEKKLLQFVLEVALLQY